MSELTGILKKVRWLSMKYLLLFCYVISIIDAAPSISPMGAPWAAPDMPNLPLPADLPVSHKHWQKHFLPRAAPVALSPAHPPFYGPLITAGHPPTTSRLSRPAMKRSGLAPPLAGFQNIAPAQSSAGTIPSGLAQPPLTLPFPTVANQTCLSRLNISMDITPYTGVSFSASDASAINSSLVMHKVNLDPALVGDYKLLNITWFKPPPTSQAPVATSPVEAPSKPSPTHTSLTASSKGKHSNLSLIIGIGAGILLISIIAVLILCLCAFRQEKTKESNIETAPEKQRSVETVPAVGSLPHPSSTRFLAFEELKQATNNFETASILGEGGFGKVFKGVLSDGTAVAIKRLTNGGQQGDKEFLVEVEMLSRLHHRNLVKLVGYYSSRDSSQNLLCYELVPNGSLEAWLHGPLGVNCPLDWDTRMKIALDAARGLAYLHEDSQPCVIHRDFKASNILLENNFHAKVADFGLAKQAPEGRANYLSTRVMGTFGYVAPEYAMTGHLLVKSDVYSYGVVLLELLTGRKPVDMSQPAGQENLVTWARPILRDKDRLDELADPSLEGKYPTEDFVRVCTIAAACVAPEASQRPTMGEVVQSLKMVQRITEYQDSMLTSSTARPNHRQSSTTFESDVSSSMFSSGPYSGLSALDNDNVSRAAVFSEDLHEGR
ncbi:proline-rich receptor-like protein kinase PERK3 isoform X2 [Prunus yedoensis var. nudiflora]|uniref:Proline-rich receptor-like protein kinase PERK3 isoform X2 n=1 Tax=Prunus yedoensis var. nudiflora TaxID=2094558 RepID=A0A314ZY60_PRUYE|nr:proline-rich receptor-like protein kinase PERK3 isoform X2 [Prunus yedoensis var. nudiflora]